MLSAPRLLTLPAFADQTETEHPTRAISLRFSGLRAVVAFSGVMCGNERLFEATINLAQFPEDQNKDNHDYEQQERNVHLVVSSSKGLATPGRLLN